MPTANYQSKTKASLIKIIEAKEKNYDRLLSDALSLGKENDDLEQQQQILIYLLVLIFTYGVFF
tara:strand:+ start:1324 stop:1515 length:192 start_codon:yes stop_codon:yes gene_type:complete